MRFKGLKERDARKKKEAKEVEDVKKDEVNKFERLENR